MIETKYQYLILKEKKSWKENTTKWKEFTLQNKISRNKIMSAPILSVAWGRATDSFNPQNFIFIISLPSFAAISFKQTLIELNTSFRHSFLILILLIYFLRFSVCWKAPLFPRFLSQICSYFYLSLLQFVLNLFFNIYVSFLFYAFYNFNLSLFGYNPFFLLYCLPFFPYSFSLLPPPILISLLSSPFFSCFPLLSLSSSQLFRLLVF